MKYVPWLFITIWCSACLAGVLLFSQMSIKEFDPQLRLADASRDMAFEREFSSTLAESGITMKNVVVHFRQPDCLCERVSRSHISKVSTEASRRGLANATVDLSESQHRFDFIPSTPAVAVFDESGRLSYLGPYGEGDSCLSASVGVDTVLSERASEVSLPQTVIVTEASGCYCEV